MAGRKTPKSTAGAAGSSATIAVYSVKGGVGKTTIAANLAWCSAELSGHPTLLWDLDAAGGSGFLYGLEPKGSKLAEDVFSKERPAEALIRETSYDMLDILPADESIRALDAQLMQIGKRKRLAKLTEGLAERYTRIILDCPPVMNELSSQVIRAADLIIVPLPPSPLSKRAFDIVVREVAGTGKRHPPILPVFSMLDLRRGLHREARAQNPDWPAIPYASAVEQCAAQQRPVGEIAARSSAAGGFNALWRAIERKLAQLGK
ncbi:chromosome partitioning protein ParA [Novosphingobium sp. PC22D]|uniref:ParA family protein n=1 Tax=Novosphingobium sp. PC22D TaxID=1962403 RepID=UPI000BFAB18B|nr:ParA family protein [Novosphingobium sp. PC22D]PEQ14753.1 chromosome partitioning protein ParA [Novosphingobium sp. PC22D]